MKRFENIKSRRRRQHLAVRPGPMFFLQKVVSDGWYLYVLPLYPKVRKLMLFSAGAGIGISILAVVVFMFFGKEVGYLEAKYDLWRHHYEIRTYGRLGVDEMAYRKMLAAHGIHYRRIAGCAVNLFIIDKMATYNRTMKKAIKTDLGLNVDQMHKLFRILDEMGDDFPHTRASLPIFGFIRMTWSNAT